MFRIFMPLLPLTAMAILASAAELNSPAGSWRVIEIKGRATGATILTTFKLTETGGVAGNAGCNLYRAQSKLKGHNLSFGPVMSTEKACAPTHMVQESAFLVQLSLVRGWRIDSGKLLLLDERNSVVLRAER